MEAEKQRLVAQKFEQKARTGDVMITEKTTFAGLMLVPEVLEGLGVAGFEVPSPIQLQAIPLGRAGLGKDIFRIAYALCTTRFLICLMIVY